MTAQRPFLQVLALCILSLVACPPVAWASEPTTESVAEKTPAYWQSLRDKNILEWTPEEQFNGYPNIRHINPTREIPASVRPWPLSQDLWTNTQDWEAQMAELNLAGLLVIQGGQIRFEQYRRGHAPDKRWMSFSIAKSVVSLLYGIAIKEGHIQSLEDTVATHLPQFVHTGYADVTIGNLLRMASGVQWNEDYQDPNSDVAALDNASESDVLEHLASLPNLHPQGSVFNYNTGETILAGAILAKAVGMSLSEYLHLRVWSPFGMASNADWALMGAQGAEMGGCCISATLRDYGRLGLFALNSGKTQSNESLLPQDWMLEATQPSLAAEYYGYFWWLSDDGDYRASGIFGQGIHISPSHDLVVAMHGLWPVAIDQDLSKKRTELIGAIKHALNQSASD